VLSCLFPLLEVEIDFNVDGDIDFLPVLRAGLELPLLQRLNSIVGESKRKPTNDANDVDRPVLLDDRLEDNRTVIAAPPQWFSNSRKTFRSCSPRLELKFKSSKLTASSFIFRR
jgi:hypothetical protein